MRKEKEVTEKIVRVAIAAGVGLAGCTPTLLRPNEPIETPSQGQALAIGLLNEQSINNLPDGEVKTSFVNELNDIKIDCAEIQGCLTDTIQIYRVNVNDPEEGTNVFSYHFANIDDSDGLRTQILSVTDGKTQEKTEINEDLVAKDTVIEGIPTRVFGYVDDVGNSHYLLVDREVSGKSQFQIYDAEGTSYDVITQNEKEVQAYSSFWSAPGIVEAAPLPTNTPTAEVAPTETVTQTPTEKAPASTEWQVSPDGHVVYKESELYDGMFTINKEHPEYVEKYWEDVIGGLWRLNYLSENKDFLEQFPSADALVKYIKGGGGPISNMRIPVVYPSNSKGTLGRAAMYPTDKPVDLSAISLSIYKPTEEESLAYIKYLDEDYETAIKRSPYLAYQGEYGGLLIEEKQIAEKNILSFTFRKDYLEDFTAENASGEMITYFSLNSVKKPDENLKGVLQLILEWNYICLYGQTESLSGDGSPVWNSKRIPSMLELKRMAIFDGKYNTFANSPEPPIIIR